MSQVILTISQIMWCRDLTEGLECKGSHLEALEAFEKVNFEVSSLSERHCTAAIRDGKMVPWIGGGGESGGVFCFQFF